MERSSSFMRNSPETSIDLGDPDRALELPRSASGERDHQSLRIEKDQLKLPVAELSGFAVRWRSDRSIAQ
jgi:hypothetical protein